MKTIIALFSLILLFAACEDIVEIDLDSIEPQLVIEGTINDIDDECIIRLSKTGDYFDLGNYTMVSNADVSVTDNNDETTIFEEVEPGVYTSRSLKGTENTSYTLNVMAEGEHYKAAVTMPQKVSIDSLSYETTPLILGFGEEGYTVSCHLRDPLELENYYRMFAYLISDTTKADDSFLILNDDFVEGNQIILEWDLESFQLNDTVVVELRTLEKSTYEYYYTMFPLVGGGDFGAANPANPETNLNNEALGIFGTYTISRDTIIISTAL